MLRLTVAILAVCLIASLAQPIVRAQTATEAPPGSAARGEQLFTGEVHLLNGGPACVSCHDIAGLRFPGGGTLGPDLTQAYRKLGPTGTQSAIQTLYFRVMTPIYGQHPLQAGEQADLMAFLEQVESRPQSLASTPILLLAALVFGAILVALTGFLWRGRVKSVRRALVQRATRQGAPL